MVQLQFRRLAPRATLVVLTLALQAGCTPTHASHPPAARARPAVAAPVAETEAAVAQRALAGVVLVVTQRADGKVGYGSGVLMPGNVALTNHHVVDGAKSIAVMFYDSERPSYATTDGGLNRYLFENDKSLVAARTIRSDTQLDLAVLEIAGDTVGLPRLPMRMGPVMIGERVLALGHPAENVWSFTSGSVSSLRVGVVQTDAAINEGNSGGALLDSRGRIVGINTLKLIGGIQGIAYAVPTALADAFVRGTAGGIAVDRASPETASRTCSRAAELAAPSWAECDDGLSAVDLSEAAMDVAALAFEDPPQLLEYIRFRRSKRSRASQAQFVVRTRAALIRGDEAVFKELVAERDAAAAAWHGPTRADVFSALSEKRLRDVARRLEVAKQRLDRDHTLMPQVLEQRTGLKRDMRALWFPSERDVLRMGMRIERVTKVDSSQAWVHIKGRNRDGTAYAYSQLWMRSESGWSERAVPTAQQSLTLPQGFPSPAFDWDAVLAHQAEHEIASWEGVVVETLGRAK